MRRETLVSDLNEQKSSSEKDHLIMCPLPMVKLCAFVCVYFGVFVYLCISVFVYFCVCVFLCLCICREVQVSGWEACLGNERSPSPQISYLPISLLTRNTGYILYLYSHFCIQDISKKWRLYFACVFRSVIQFKFLCWRFLPWSTLDLSQQRHHLHLSGVEHRNTWSLTDSDGSVLHINNKIIDVQHRSTYKELSTETFESVKPCVEHHENQFNWL